MILNCICKSCSSLLIDDDNKSKYFHRFNRNNLNTLQRQSFLKKLVEECKKIRICPKCKSLQGTVKRILGQNLRICHVKWKN